MKCRVCRAQIEPEQDHLCDGCRSLAALARERLEAAKASALPRPTERPPCLTCGFPMDPVLFRPDGPWTFYCVMGCHFCTCCRRTVRYDQVCPCWHCARCTYIDPRRGRSLRLIPSGTPCPSCGARQSEATLPQ